ARRCPDTRNHPNHRCARAAAGTIVGRRSSPEGPDHAPATTAARARIPAPDGRRRPRREAVPGGRSVAKVAIRGRTVEQRWLFALATALDTRPGLATVVASALGTAVPSMATPRGHVATARRSGVHREVLVFRGISLALATLATAFPWLASRG